MYRDARIGLGIAEAYRWLLEVLILNVKKRTVNVVKVLFCCSQLYGSFNDQNRCCWASSISTCL